MTPIKRATHRLMYYDLPHHGGHLPGDRLDPVVEADWRGGMNDCRAALSIACGVPLDLIDPARGTGPDCDFEPTDYTPIGEQ